MVCFSSYNKDNNISFKGITTPTTTKEIVKKNNKKLLTFLITLLGFVGINFKKSDTSYIQNPVLKPNEEDINPSKKIQKEQHTNTQNLKSNSNTCQTDSLSQNNESNIIFIDGFKCETANKEGKEGEDKNEKPVETLSLEYFEKHISDYEQSFLAHRRVGQITLNSNNKQKLWEERLRQEFIKP